MTNSVKSRARRQRVAFALLILFLTVTHARASDPCPADFKAVEPRPKSVKEVLSVVRACRDTGHPERAEALLLMGLDWAQRADSNKQIAIAFLGSHARELTDLYVATGRTEEVGPLLRRIGAAVARRHAPEHLARIASRHAFAGSKHADAGELDMARRELEWALDVYDGAGGITVDGIATFAATELTMVQSLRGDYAAAADAWARVAAMRQQAFGSPNLEVTAGWRELAFLQRMADRPEAARASLLRAYTRERAASMPSLDPVVIEGLTLGFLRGIGPRLLQRENRLAGAAPNNADPAALAATREAQAAFLLANGKVELATQQFESAQETRRASGQFEPKVLKARAHWFANLIEHLADEQDLIDLRNAGR